MGNAIAVSFADVLTRSVTRNWRVRGRIAAKRNPVILKTCDSGGFMLIRSPNGSYEFIDFRETAPAASHRDMFVDNPDAAKYGGLSVAVP